MMELQTVLIGIFFSHKLSFFYSVFLSNNNLFTHSIDSFRYPIYGGMQDWNYIHEGCFEWTVEISDLKWPKATEVCLSYSHQTPQPEIMVYI